MTYTPLFTLIPHLRPALNTTIVSTILGYGEHNSTMMANLESNPQPSVSSLQASGKLATQNLLSRLRWLIDQTLH